MAAIGLGQSLGGGEVEPPIVTAGDDIKDLARFLTNGKTSYHATDELEFMLGTSAVSSAAS